MKNLITIIILIFLSLNFVFAQQQPVISHYLNNKILVNPAVTGSDNYSPVRLIAKSQWTGFDDKSPKTQLLSGHTRIDEVYGIGGYLFNDKYGNVRKTGISVAYSYHLKFEGLDAGLSLGLAASAFQFSLDQTSYIYFDNNDEAITRNKESSFVPNFDFGAFFYAENYYLGLSGANLLGNKITLGAYSSKDNRIERRVKFIGGYNFELAENIDIEPSTLLDVSESVPFQYTVNANVIYNKLYYLGFSYRNYNCISILAGLKIMKKYHIGYAFDITTSEISNYSNGTHEIILGIDLENSKSNSNSLIE